MFFGPVTGRLASSDAGVAWSGNAPGDMAGTSLAAGDVDGDGAVDLLVGASHADTPFVDAGGVWLIPGPIRP